MLSSVAHYDIDKCLPCMALCGLVWPYVASYGLDVAFHGHYYVWPYLNHHGLVWPFYGLKCHFMVFYGKISSFLPS